MPAVLILCAHRPGRSPSQRYRFEQYLPYLRSNGFEFTWAYLLNEEEDRMFYSEGNSLTKARLLLGTLRKRKKTSKTFSAYDIIFIQREASFLGHSRYERKAFESGAKVIFDFDDSIWKADTSPGNKKWEWIKKPEKFFDNIRYAHAVIAGNEYLAEKARTANRHVTVIPTTVDTDHHIPMPDLRNREKVTVGWSGSISTIKHFEMLLPVFRELKNKYGERIKFKIIGQEHYSAPGLDVECVKWTPENEVRELNSLDIGVMPLPDDEWAKGKCGLKGLTYMACEVAAVMSPVGVNSQIVTDGENGLIARTDEEWVSKISLLIDDPGLRKRIAAAGRKTVIERFSVGSQKKKYLDLFHSVISSR